MGRESGSGRPMIDPMLDPDPDLCPECFDPIEAGDDAHDHPDNIAGGCHAECCPTCNPDLLGLVSRRRLDRLADIFELALAVCLGIVAALAVFVGVLLLLVRLGR
jgi:hypothetical protein